MNENVFPDISSFHFLSHKYRYALTTIGGLFVFVLFWILISKLNNNSDPSDITASDKNVFWVRAQLPYDEQLNICTCTLGTNPCRTNINHNNDCIPQMIKC